jgi:preprotein translocase SecE subunit
MANKTVDRKKAVPARSQAAKASPKNTNAKAPRPSANTQVKPSALKSGQSASASAEVLETEQMEVEETVVEEEEDVVAEESGDLEEEDEEVVEVDEEEEEEEEVVEEKPAKSRFAKNKSERAVMEVTTPDYSVKRSTRNVAFLNNPPGRFLTASYRELKLVTWPSRRDTWNWSLVVIGVAVAIAILLGAADLGLSKFVTWWLSLAH